MSRDTIEPSPEMRRAIMQSVQGARQRSRKNSSEVAPDLGDLTLQHFREHRGRCALTGIRFDLEEIGTGQARRPFAPSVDRIDSEGGYTADNIRLVCQVVNFALNHYGEDVFYQMAKAAARYIGAFPDPIEMETEDGEKERKSAYIEFVVAQAPKLLAEHGGRVPKGELRQQLRRAYHHAIPTGEANAYGWAFRRLTEDGVLEPSSGQRDYVLRRLPED